MQWRKQGLLFRPKSTHSKLLSHAANPLPILLENDIYRIFYCGRDNKNRSSVGYVDIDIIQRKVIYVQNEPVFEHGPADSFYSHGVSIGNCYKVDGSQYILFMGWQIPKSGHWHGNIGRLRLNSDLSLDLDNGNDKPFFACNLIDPISLSYPWVMSDDGAGYHMWYGSTLKWHSVNDEMIHTINYASSSDGITWDRKGVAVPYEIGIAQAFSKPTVVYDKKNGYSMWFSYRSGSGEKYRIGHAKSDDSRNWELKLEEIGIKTSQKGWDSEMIEYPFVFDHKGKRYMLYNGNNYGASGFGLAVMENENTSP